MKFIVTLILLGLISCTINQEKLILINKTEEILYFRLCYDTLVQTDTYLYQISPQQSIKPNFVRGLRSDLWECEINNYCSDSSLHIFFFGVPKLNDSIIKNHCYKRMDLKVVDLERLKWIIEYK